MAANVNKKLMILANRVNDKIEFATKTASLFRKGGMRDHAEGWNSVLHVVKMPAPQHGEKLSPKKSFFPIYPGNARSLTFLSGSNTR